MKSKTNLKSQGLHYTVPQICQSTNEWYVYFRFFHAGKWVMKKCREGINRIQDRKERMKDAIALAEARHSWLEQGWNPITDPDFKARKFTRSEDLKIMLLGEALDFALEKKRPDLAKKSYQDYKNIVEIVKKHSKNVEIGYLALHQITRLHILELMQNLVIERKITNHRHNIILGCIRSLFTTLETWLLVPSNPATKIAMKPVAESNMYATFTAEEKNKIEKHLKIVHPQLFIFTEFVYHTGIRPKELLALKLSDLDLKRRIITIVPSLSEENSKTKFVRTIPINDHLHFIIMGLSLQKYPSSYYLFGSPFEPGLGNRGGGSQKRKVKGSGTKKSGISGAMRTDFLQPSQNRANRDTVTKLWQKLIKDPISGLGINKCMYAAKHTGADDKILAGIDLDALKTLYGHRNKQMTERYAKAVKDVYHNTIIENSPSFNESTGNKFF